MEHNPKVSVHMPAFNHGPYIGKALDSVLMQKVNFPYEIVVGEDASTDETREVTLAYARQYPKIVRVLLHPRNLGIYENDQSIIQACRGRYVAWLESDDYWTSPDKLQMQVDLMDRLPDHSACFHRAGHVGDSELPPTWRGGPPRPQSFYTVDDLLEEGHFVPSCTAVFRTELARDAAAWTRDTPFLETTYFVRFALKGKIGFLDQEMAMFRCRAGGIYGASSRTRGVRSAIRTHRLLGKHLGLDRRESYRRGLRRLYLLLSQEFRREGRPVKALISRLKAHWHSPALPSGDHRS